MTKQCTKCKKRKSLLSFFSDRQKRDGLTSHCKVCKRTTHLSWYWKNQDERKEKSGKYYKTKSGEIKKYGRERYREIVNEIFELLGEKCSRCGYEDKRAIQIDHVNGGGNRERVARGNTVQIYKDILDGARNGSKDFKLLCANCNIIEGIEKGYKKSIWHQK